MQEPVDSGCGMIHQRVATDVNDIAILRFDRVEGAFVALRFRSVCRDEGFVRPVVEHQTESGISVEPVAADMLDAVRVEFVTDNR